MKSEIMSSFKQEQKKTHLILPLIFLVISSLALSIVTVLDLEWEDHVTNTKGVLLFAYGLIFFTALYHTLNHLVLYTNLGRNAIKKYKLTKANVLDVSNKQVSAVQALFCCITGITSCTYSCRRDMLKTSHYISEAYAWFGAAYFLYDIWSMYKVHSASIPQHQTSGDAVKRPSISRKIITYLKSEAVIVGHHIFIGGFGFLVITSLRGGLGDCFFGFIYLMEASTPFVSIRGILSKIGMKNSRFYIVNGLLMMGSFLIFRIAMFPYVIYLYSQSVDMTYFEAIASLPRGCKISILILVLPQTYWFLLMLKGALNVLKPKKKSIVTLDRTKNSNTKT